MLVLRSPFDWHSANGELSLLNNKVQGLEKELELERRKIRELQDAARERDKEYQKLKVCDFGGINLGRLC